MIHNTHFRNERIAYLRKLIPAKQAALRKAPAGRLKVKQEKSRFYYCYQGSSSASTRYLRINDSRDMALARALAQRGYDEKVLKLATQELKLLEREAAFYDKGCADDVFEVLGKGLQALVTPIRMPDAEYIAKWLAQPYPKKGFKEGALSFETKRGDKVRSKSEVMIADGLFLDDIPYLYEKPVQLIDLMTGRPIIVYPDFTVLDIRERKTFLWEHLGMCDDPDYMNMAVKKLIEYENAGYHLEDNLIVTFETRRFPFTPDRAQEVIDRFFK